MTHCLGYCGKYCEGPNLGQKLGHVLHTLQYIVSIGLASVSHCDSFGTYEAETALGFLYHISYGAGLNP